MLVRNVRRRSRLPRGWLPSSLISLVFGLLVAGGVADRDLLLPLLVIVVAAGGLTLLHLLFPRGPHFAFGTSAAFVVYACLFAVIGRAAFPQASDGARVVAFLLPIAAFLFAVWSQRERLRRLAEAQQPFDLAHLPRMGRWLLPVFLVGGAAFVLPVRHLSTPEQGVALVAAMAAIALIVGFSVNAVVALLTDVALLTEELSRRAARLAVPVVAFLALYGVLVVVFACFYRIAQGVSAIPLFVGPQGPVPFAFEDALYFSLVTQATVGYGDITPEDPGIRILASVQVIAGQVLLLFGFAEIMRSRHLLSAEEERQTPAGP